MATPKDVLTASRHSSTVPCPEQPTHPSYDKLALLSRAQIATRIAAGELLIVHLPLVYRVPTAWLDMHPGRDKAILHYVGRDASNEIEAYHTGRTVSERMRRWVVGRVEVGEDGWRDMVPPIQLSLWPPPTPTVMVTPATPITDKAPADFQDFLGKEAAELEEPPRLLTTALIDPPLVNVDQLPLTPCAHLFSFTGFC